METLKFKIKEEAGLGTTLLSASKVDPQTFLPPEGELRSGREAYIVLTL